MYGNIFYLKNIGEKQQQWVDHESDLYKNKDLRYLKFVAKKQNPGISDTEAEEMAKDVLDGRRKDFTRKYFNDEMKALEKANDDYEAAVEKYGAESEEAAKAGKILNQAHKNFTEAEMLFDPGTGEFKSKDKFTKAEQGNLAEYNESIDQRAKELAETTDREDLEDLSNDLYYDLYCSRYENIYIIVYVIVWANFARANFRLILMSLELNFTGT